MEANDVIDKIIKELNNFEREGNTTLNVHSLSDYLNQLRNEVSSCHDFDLETLKAKNQIKIEKMKLDEAIRLESFKSTISSGMNAAKSCMLINGGASVALLAFIGNIWSKGSLGMAAMLVSKGLLFFCSGVALAALCTGFTYLAQSAYTSSELGTNKKWSSWGTFCNSIAIFSALLSLIVFGFGSYQTYLSMASQFASN
jgi:hypothetical protein